MSDHDDHHGQESDEEIHDWKSVSDDNEDEDDENDSIDIDIKKKKGPNKQNIDEEKGDSETTMKARSISHDDLLGMIDESIHSLREESRSAGTDEGSLSESRRSSLRNKRQKAKSTTKERINSDESEEPPQFRDRDSSDELSPRYRLESFDNPFSFDDVDAQTPKNKIDMFDDDEDDETFHFRTSKDHSMYSDPSDDENEKKKTETKALEQSITKRPPDYFGNEDDSKSNLFPESEGQSSLSITNSLKNLQKATSVVAPSDILERPRTESDKSKENETRSPFLTTSFSSTNSNSVSPEPPRTATGTMSPKSPPSMISDQIPEESIILNTEKTNKPSPLQVMTSQRWNTPKRSKPVFAQFTEVHSFANAVKIVPDCDRALVLCATADSTVRLIDAITGKVQGMFEGHSDRVLAVSINEKIPGHDTIQYVVAGSRDETVCVWDFKTRACLRVLSGHDGAVWAVAVYVSLNGPPLAFSGSSDCSIRSWNILTGVVQHIFKGHSDTVLSLALYHGGQYTLSSDCKIISGGADHMVRVWDMSTGRHSRMLEGHTDDVNAVAVVEDPFGNLFKSVKIVSGGRDRTIRVWDLQRGAQIAEFSGHADCVYGVCGMVGKFRTLQGTSTSTKPTPKVPQAIKQVSTRGTVVGNVNRSNSIWAKDSHGTRDISDSIPEIFLIASCSEDRTVKLWDVLGERLLVTSKEHKGSVKGISMSPIALPGDALTLPSASILLATCSWDKSVLYYDVDTLLTAKEKTCCIIS